MLHFGPVTSCRVEQVKGITYNLQHFLGEPNWPHIDRTRGSEDYVRNLVRNPQNVLYQLTIYLAPGDYHRFHSPADWTIKSRRHFQGEMLKSYRELALRLSNRYRAVVVAVWGGGWHSSSKHARDQLTVPEFFLRDTVPALSA